VTDPFFDAYCRVRERVEGLVSSPDADPTTPIPACPGWTVHAVVAHLAGLAEDVIVEDTDHYAEPGWTAQQVARRHEAPIAEMLTAWEAAIPRLRQAALPPIGRAFKTVGRLFFVDASVHEHDLRGALGAPGPEDEAVRVGLESSVDLLARLLRRPQEQGEVPSLRVTALGEKSWDLLGGGPDPVSVEGSAFELWRGLTGRRSEGQVRQLRWSSDPAPFLPYWAFGPLSFADQPLSY
jgi:uncharacterized protein (TIGR03083 family)